MHIFPLILVSLFSMGGWLIGRNNPRHKEKKSEKTLAKDYFVGLNYLLNEQPDQAVDIFIRMLEVDKNTVETHMALGSLFRRKGETNRAIRVHQNIIARPNLSKAMRVQALQELGRDYMVAGVYDRAERLFLEAVETGGEHRIQSLKHLIDIYEREKDWFAALEMAQQLQKTAAIDKGKAIAQYYCEIVQDPRKQLSFNEISEYLRLAYSADRHCVRTGILKAKQENESGSHKAAIKIYKKLIKQDSSFIPMLLPLLQKEYQHIDDEKAFVDYLYQSLDENPQPLLITMIAEKLQAWHGTNAAVDFLLQQLHEHPSLLALEYVVSMQATLLRGTIREQAELVQKFLHRLETTKPKYLCDHCGYSGKKMHWLCPSCRRWGEVKPRVDE